MMPPENLSPQELSCISEVQKALEAQRQKIFEKAWFIPPPNETIIQGFSKDPRLSNETTFKQKLEDAGLTKWGWLQIESVMKVLWEKSEKIGA